MISARLATHFIAVYLLLCLNRFVAGARVPGGCLAYGHSCWGGHGKRSFGERESDGYHSTGRSSSWYLSRLLKTPRDPIDARNIFGPENIVRGPDHALATDFLLPDNENRKLRPVGENFSEDDDWPISEGNESNNEVLVVSPEEAAATKVRLYRLLNEDMLRKHAMG